MERLIANLPADLKAYVETDAEKRRVSISEAIRSYIKEHKRKYGTNTRNDPSGRARRFRFNARAGSKRPAAAQEDIRLS
jgi:hypothetical protein